MSNQLVGLIPAAGLGTRVRPYSDFMPKSMLPINGIPNLLRIIELMRDQLDIRQIVIITGYFAEVIEDYFRDGSDFGVGIQYVRNTSLEKGLAWSILLGKQWISAPYFCVILSDECYVNSNHGSLKDARSWGNFATCCTIEVDDISTIAKNYSVQSVGSKVTQLIEKPKDIKNNILGLGTFLLSSEIFIELDKAFSVSPNNYVEFVTFLDNQIQQGKDVRVVPLQADYVNINDRDSLFLAKYNERNALFSNRTISLLLYSEGNESQIDLTVKSYLKNKSISKIYCVVPDKNSIGHISDFGVQLIVCPSKITQYGEKLRYALDMVTSDIILIAEGDYAFLNRDIDKLLAYICEADLVVGTRTTRQLIEQGSDLSELVRLANVFLAKIMEVVLWRFEGRFTDVGCTFRAFWRSSYLEIRDSIHSRGAEFAVEMVMEALKRRMRVVEIPVNYRNVSRSMYKIYRNRKTFLKILKLIVTKRFGR